MFEFEIPRDRWGRPLITPDDGGKPIPYTRVSTLSKALDDKTALSKWMCRQTAIGLAQRPDLLQLVQSNPDSKTTVGDAVEQAMATAKSSAAANIGTALHSFTEQVDAGVDPDTMPSELRDDLRAYEQTMAEMQIRASEVFIVCDPLEAAGTFDRLMQLPDGRLVVADLKTGQNEPNYPHATAMQIAIYSRGTFYTPDTGRAGRLADLGVNQDTGIMIHLPAGTGKCHLYELDLNAGWDLACTAAAVRKAYKTKPIVKYS